VRAQALRLHLRVSVLPQRKVLRRKAPEPAAVGHLLGHHAVVGHRARHRPVGALAPHHGAVPVVERLVVEVEDARAGDLDLKGVGQLRVLDAALHYRGKGLGCAKNHLGTRVQGVVCLGDGGECHINNRL